jgi:hypothetical protein
LYTTPSGAAADGGDPGGDHHGLRDDNGMVRVWDLAGTLTVA